MSSWVNDRRRSLVSTLFIQSHAFMSLLQPSLERMHRTETVGFTLLVWLDSINWEVLFWNSFLSRLFSSFRCISKRFPFSSKVHCRRSVSRFTFLWNEKANCNHETHSTKTSLNLLWKHQNPQVTHQGILSSQLAPKFCYHRARINRRTRRNVCCCSDTRILAIIGRRMEWEIQYFCLFLSLLFVRFQLSSRWSWRLLFWRLRSFAFLR